MSATNSFACRRPPATRVKVASPFGGSPRSAMRFSTPCSVALPSHRRSWSVVDPTQVRCAAVVTPNVSRILTVSSSVLSRVDPPAPYVQVTMEGVNVISSSRAAKSCASPASVLGGKIWKDRANFRSPYSSEILIPEIFSLDPEPPPLAHEGDLGGIRSARGLSQEEVAEGLDLLGVAIVALLFDPVLVFVGIQRLEEITAGAAGLIVAGEAGGDDEMAPPPRL